MNTRFWLAPLLALSVMATIPACAPTAKQESPGQYLDDSVITGKVKAAILADEQLKVLQINVETFKQVVQLSGFVESAAMKSRAASVAGGVEGVRSVRNDLIVR